jgi:hypothetical protein
MLRITGGGHAFFRVTLGDETWEFDPAELTLGQLKSIEAETGQSTDEWIADLQRGMTDALRVLIWWLQGRKVKPDQVDFRMADFDLEIVPRPVKKPPKAAGKKPEIVRSAS